MRSALFPVVAIIVLAIACGGDHNGDETTPDATLENDDELARSILLTVADFPSGWSETPAEHEESPADKCDPARDPKGRTGRAETGDFSGEGRASASQTVAIFDTPQKLEAALATYSQFGECLRTVVENRELDTDEGEFSDVTFSIVSFPEYGDATDAYRLKIHFKSRRQTGLGSEGDFYSDVVFVANGRIGFSIVGTDAFRPFDTELLKDIVSKAQTRVEDVPKE